MLVIPDERVAHRDLHQAVVELGCDLRRLGALGQVDHPAELAVEPLADVELDVVSLDPRAPGPGDGQHAVGEPQVDLLGVDPGELDLDHEVVPAGQDVGGRHPRGRVGALRGLSPGRLAPRGHRGSASVRAR